MDCIQCILDGHTLQVPRRDLKPQREVEIDLLDWRFCKVFLKNFLIVQRGWGSVKPPERDSQHLSVQLRNDITVRKQR